MSWKKYKILIFGGSFCLILAAIAAFFLFRFSGQASDAEDDLDNAVQSVTRLKTGAVYPNAANVKALQKQQEELATHLVAFRSSLLEGQVAPVEVVPSRFTIHVTQFRTRLTDPKDVKVLKDATKEAGNAPQVGLSRGRGALEGIGFEPESEVVEVPEEPEGHRVQIPPGFGFGFDQYISQGLRPRDEEIPRLTLQMQLVELICKELYAAQIDVLEGVERQRFEITAEDERLMRLGAGQEAALLGNEGFGLGEDVDMDEDAGGDLYTTETLRIEFQAKEPAIWEVLNRLSASKHTLLVKAVTLKNQNTHLQPSLDTTKSVGRSSARGRSRSRQTTEDAGMLPGKELVRVSLDVQAVLYTAPAQEESETAQAEAPTP